MAFSPGRERDAGALQVGDLLLLYATRGCFHNPTRDRGRVIGRATVRKRARTLEEPVTFAGRVFTLGCDIRVRGLAPFGAGVELAPLVKSLASFPDVRSWSARMRRPLVPLAATDASRLLSLLAPLEGDLDAARATYVARAHTKVA
jgi:hypothetical protein